MTGAALVASAVVAAVGRDVVELTLTDRGGRRPRRRRGWWSRRRWSRATAASWPSSWPPRRGSTRSCRGRRRAASRAGRGARRQGPRAVAAHRPGGGQAGPSSVGAAGGRRRSPRGSWPQRVAAVDCALVLHEARRRRSPRSSCPPRGRSCWSSGPRAGSPTTSWPCSPRPGRSAVRLGPEVLRASTAAAVALGALGVLTGRWQPRATRLITSSAPRSGQVWPRCRRRQRGDQSAAGRGSGRCPSPSRTPRARTGSAS